MINDIVRSHAQLLGPEHAIGSVRLVMTADRTASALSIRWSGMARETDEERTIGTDLDVGIGMMIWASLPPTIIPLGPADPTMLYCDAMEAAWTSGAWDVVIDRLRPGTPPPVIAAYAGQDTPLARRLADVGGKVHIWYPMDGAPTIRQIAHGATDRTLRGTGEAKINGYRPYTRALADLPVHLMVPPANVADRIIIQLGQAMARPPRRPHVLVPARRRAWQISSAPVVTVAVANQAPGRGRRLPKPALISSPVPSPSRANSTARPVSVVVVAGSVTIGDWTTAHDHNRADITPGPSGRIVGLGTIFFGRYRPYVGVRLQYCHIDTEAPCPAVTSTT